MVFNAALASGVRETVLSPDGKVVAAVELIEGRPLWSVAYSDNIIIRNGLLGIETAPENFCGTYTLLGKETATGDSTWKAVWGNLSEIRDHFNQLTIKLQETTGKGRTLHVILRAYNEGVGLRYVFPQQSDLHEVTIKKRVTEFRFTNNHVIYDNRKYAYGTGRIDSLTVKSDNNITVDVGRGNFVSLTDADRSDYCQVVWIAKSETPNTIVEVPLGKGVIGTLPFKTSWQVMLIGETLGKLYENRCIVDNLNPPCALTDTSWIRPGMAICQIRNGRIVNAEMKKLLDFASAHKFAYMEIDHSWNGAETKWTPAEIANFENNKKPFWDAHPEWRQNIRGNPMVAATGYVPFRPDSYNSGNLVDLDLPELCAYGKKLNPPVGVCVYVRG